MNKYINTQIYFCKVLNIKLNLSYILKVSKLEKYFDRLTI